MKTIDYTIGETKIWRAIPRNAAGQMVDLTGVEAELRVTVSGALCLKIAAAPDNRGFPFSLSPASLDLASGRYAARLWIRWPDGQERAYDPFTLVVARGC